MNINPINRAARSARVGLAFFAFISGCDTPGESTQHAYDEPERARAAEDTESPAEQGPDDRRTSQTEPSAVIPASPATLAATDGVTAWKVYDGESVRIVGVDADDRTIADVQLHVDLADDGAPRGVVVETIAPERGSMTFDASGHVVENTLDEPSGRLFAALTADLQSADGEAAQFSSWECSVAEGSLVLECSQAVVACVVSFGWGCLLSGLGCILAVDDYMCACKDSGC